MNDFKAISEIAKVRRGASPRPIDDPRYFGGDVGWIRIVDVTRANRFLRSTDQYLSKLGESKSVRVDKGDLIMSICATIGRPIIVDMAACIHDGFVQIYDINGAETAYLYYALEHAENDFKNMGQLGTQANLNTSLVERHVLFIPHIGEQRKIANILSTIDDQIEQTHSLIAKYNAIKQGIMQDLLVRGVDSHGRIRPTYDQAPGLYQGSEIGYIPKDWRVKTLRTVSIGGAKNGYFKKPELVGNGYKLINVSELYQPFGIDTSLPFVQRVEAIHADFERYKVAVGDIFFTRSSLVLGGIAACNIVREIREPTLFECHVIKITPNKDVVSPEFVAYWCRDSFARSYYMSRAKQTTMTTISQPEIEGTPIPVPPLDEQHKIASILISVDRFIEETHSLLAKQNAIRKGMMQDLLTGKVRVNVDESTGSKQDVGVH